MDDILHLNVVLFELERCCLLELQSAAALCVSGTLAFIWSVWMNGFSFLDCVLVMLYGVVMFWASMKMYRGLDNLLDISTGSH